MSLFSIEHYEMLANFEREFKGRRLDKEDKTLWPKGAIFQDGHVNELFLAYRRGASYQSGIHCLQAVSAAPVRVLPLTEERIQALGEEIDRDASAWPRFLTDQEKRVRLARAVEAAHGISSSASGGDGEKP